MIKKQNLQKKSIYITIVLCINVVFYMRTCYFEIRKHSYDRKSKVRESPILIIIAVEEEFWT